MWARRFAARSWSASSAAISSDSTSFPVVNISASTERVELPGPPGSLDEVLPIDQHIDLHGVLPRQPPRTGVNER